MDANQTHPAIQPLPFDPSGLRGLSERLMLSHHQNNYGGAVTRLRAIRAQLAALDWASAPGYVINGLKREELVAANSMNLHELFFSCLGGDGKLAPGGLSVALARDFGSVEAWHAQFVALSMAMRGGSGWALLALSDRENRLFNHWAADHTHVPAGSTLILALDMYEHSYHLDFGADPKAYVAACMDNLHWPRISERYAAAVESATHTLAVGAEACAAEPGVMLIDVRRKGAYERGTEVIKGATWRDPERVDEWAGEVAGKEVVVYCIYGHEVGQSTAARLRDAGVSARFLTGGIDQWKAAGRPVQPK